MRFPLLERLTVLCLSTYCGCSLLVQTEGLVGNAVPAPPDSPIDGGPLDAARPDASAASWRVGASGTTVNLYAVRTTSDGNTYASGSSGVLLRSSSQRRTWQRVDLDTVATLTAMTESADHCLLVATDDQRVFRVPLGDGPVSTVALPATMFGLWTNGAGRVYGVGTALRIEVSEDDGRTFANFQPFGNSNTFNGISGIGERVFIAGNGGRLTSSTAPTAFALLDAGTTKNLFGIFARTENDVVVVGSGLILRWDGETASSVALPSLPDPVTFRAVHAAATGPFVAVSEAGQIVTIDGERAVFEPEITRASLRGVWVDPGGTMIVVGGAGTILVKD